MSRGKYINKLHSLNVMLDQHKKRTADEHNSHKNFVHGGEKNYHTER